MSQIFTTLVLTRLEPDLDDEIGVRYDGDEYSYTLCERFMMDLPVFLDSFHYGLDSGIPFLFGWSDSFSFFHKSLVTFLSPYLVCLVSSEKPVNLMRDTIMLLPV